MCSSDLPVVLLLGCLFVDLVVGQWRRIPFTCTVLFGKRPAAYTLMLAFASFYLFVFIGMGLQQLAISGPRRWLIVVAILLLISAGLRWYRLRTWGGLPLEFEDYLPDRVNTLGL